MLGFDIIDELKSWSANLIASQNSVNSPPSIETYPSLEAELNIVNNKKDNSMDNSGWRKLGSRNVWKSDWTEYDAKKSRRAAQQKLADKAKKRNKRNKAKKAEKARDYSQYNQLKNNHTNLNNKHHNCSHKAVKNHSFLPPDRVLLATAKDRFSRPPANYQPTMQFKRGEILNPYPASEAHQRSVAVPPPNWMTPSTSSAATCEAWCNNCRQSYFQQN